MSKINVQKARLRIIEKEILTAGMSEAVFCEFTFSAEWEKLNKTAVFTNGSISVDVLLDGEKIAVPAAVLTTPGKTVKIGVGGSDGSGIVLPTIWGELGTVRPSPGERYGKGA